MSMFAALGALDSSGDRSNGGPATSSPAAGGNTMRAPAAGVSSTASKKKKKKKRGGQGGQGAASADAELAERLHRLEEDLPAPAPEAAFQKVKPSKATAKAPTASAPARSLPASSVPPSNPAFAVLRKFVVDDDDDEDEDEDEDAQLASSLAERNALDAYEVSPPFLHVFEDTGKAAWCCVVTGASGYASAPVPIAAVVPRARKLAASAKPPVLEKAEEREIVLDFKRRLKEQRKAEKAEKPKKKKKKKKPPVETSPDEFAADEGTGDGAPVATVSVDAPPPKVEDGSAAAAARENKSLSESILGNLFARRAYQPPAEPEPAAEARAKDETRGPAKAPPTSEPASEMARMEETARQRRLAADEMERLAAAQAREKVEMEAEMERMRAAMARQRLDAQRAEMSAMRAQMEAMRAELEARRAEDEEVAAREEAAREARRVAAEREAAMRADWRARDGGGGGKGGAAAAAAAREGGGRRLHAQPFRGGHEEESAERRGRRGRRPAPGLRRRPQKYQGWATAGIRSGDQTDDGGDGEANDVRGEFVHSPRLSGKVNRSSLNQRTRSVGGTEGETRR